MKSYTNNTVDENAVNENQVTTEDNYEERGSYLKDYQKKHANDGDKKPSVNKTFVILVVILVLGVIGILYLRKSLNDVSDTTASNEISYADTDVYQTENTYNAEPAEPVIDYDTEETITQQQPTYETEFETPYDEETQNTIDSSIAGMNNILENASALPLDMDTENGSRLNGTSDVVDENNPAVVSYDDASANAQEHETNIMQMTQSESEAKSESEVDDSMFVAVPSKIDGNSYSFQASSVKSDREGYGLYTKYIVNVDCSDSTKNNSPMLPAGTSWTCSILNGSYSIEEQLWYVKDGIDLYSNLPNDQSDYTRFAKSDGKIYYINVNDVEFYSSKIYDINKE